MYIYYIIILNSFYLFPFFMVLLVFYLFYNTLNIYIVISIPILLYNTEP